jgi:phage tail sheath protein FI
MAQIDAEEEPWMSPGGKVIKNCVKLAFHPTKAERDDLFACNINPVTNFRAEGNILYGDWTRVSNTSFNFIGVRRLFLYIERAIKEYARTIMWKQNDEITETMFIQTIEPFLYDVQGGRGIQEFRVLAGSSVTSPDEMDRGIFRAKILIKPVRSIRYVELVFTSVRSDMNIEEIV